MAGGLSGKPLFSPSTRLLAQAYLKVGRDLPLIGVGGVSDAATALAKIEAGASLIQFYTSLALAGPSLVADILAGLTHAAREPGGLAARVGRQAAHWAGRLRHEA